MDSALAPTRTLDSGLVKWLESEKHSTSQSDYIHKSILIIKTSYLRNGYMERVCE